MKNLLVFFSLTALVLGVSGCAADDDYSVFGGREERVWDSRNKISRQIARTPNRY
ncbi:MAG: hypothetical protein R3Y61_02120 [Rikenellaceae bacterium]